MSLQTENVEYDREEKQMNDQFIYLKKYSDVYDAVLEVNRRIVLRDWPVAIQKMRTAAQCMLRHIYRLYAEGSQIPDFFNTIKQLQDAGIISQKSAGNYHQIRINGNETSHGNTNYSERETRTIYGLLLEESVLFAERYMVQTDPYGKERLRKVISAVSAPTTSANLTREKDDNSVISKGMARGIALFQLVFFLGIGCAAMSQMSQMSHLDGAVPGIAILLIGAGVLVSLYTLITGDERAILIWMLMSGR